MQSMFAFPEDGRIRYRNRYVRTRRYGYGQRKSFGEHSFGGRLHHMPRVSLDQ